MTNRLSQTERIDLDKQISNLIEEKILTETEVKILCDKVYYLNYFLIIFRLKK
jgi:hypothetical protein